MNFLTAQELEAMEIEYLAVYRCLLEQIYSLDSFGGSEVGSKLGEVRDIIVNRLDNKKDDKKDEYFVNGSKYPVTALVLQEHSSSKFFSGVTEKLMQAGEQISDEERAYQVQTQIYDNREVWKELYIASPYPADLIVRTFGKERIVKMLGEKLTLEWLESMKANKEIYKSLSSKDPKNNIRNNRDGLDIGNR